MVLSKMQFLEIGVPLKGGYRGYIWMSGGILEFRLSRN